MSIGTADKIFRDVFRQESCEIFFKTCFCAGVSKAYVRWEIWANQSNGSRHRKCSSDLLRRWRVSTWGEGAAVVMTNLVVVNTNLMSPEKFTTISKLTLAGHLRSFQNNQHVFAFQQTAPFFVVKCHLRSKFHFQNAITALGCFPSVYLAADNKWF